MLTLIESWPAIFVLCLILGGLGMSCYWIGRAVFVGETKDQKYAWIGGVIILFVYLCIFLA
jgi:phosphate starvation-inducible membrane PsiE